MDIDLKNINIVELNNFVNKLDDVNNYRNNQRNSINKSQRIKVKSLNQFINEESLDKQNILECYLYQILGINDLSEYQINNVGINEKYGKFDGQIELVKFIVNKIKHSNSDKIIIDSSDFNKDTKGIFFNELVIELNSDTNAYLPDESEYLDNEQIFDRVVIQIKSEENDKELYSTLTHELTHAWNDYSLYVNEKYISLADIAESPRGRGMEEIRKLYNSFSESNSKKLIENIGNIVYMLGNSEKNAFISEISAELLNYEGQIISFSDAKKVFEKTKPYKKFTELYQFLEYFNENSDIEQKETFVDLYDKCFAKTNKQKYNVEERYRGIYKKLKRQFNNVFNKICKIMAKTYCEWVESQKQLSESKIIDKML